MVYFFLKTKKLNNQQLMRRDNRNIVGSSTIKQYYNNYLVRYIYILYYRKYYLERQRYIANQRNMLLAQQSQKQIIQTNAGSAINSKASAVTVIKTQDSQTNTIDNDIINFINNSIEEFTIDNCINYITKENIEYDSLDDENILKQIENYIDSHENIIENQMDVILKNILKSN